MAQIKINNPQWQEKWKVLQEIFTDDFYGLRKEKDIKKLESIGFEYVRIGKHPKIYFAFNGRTYCITLSSSPSATHTGRSTLRHIRKIIDN